jgi:hypothetical protein
VNRRGDQFRAAQDCRAGRIADVGVLALVVATDEDRAAAGVARGIDNRSTEDANVIAQEPDGPAELARLQSLGVDSAGDQQGSTDAGVDGRQTSMVGDHCVRRDGNRRRALQVDDRLRGSDLTGDGDFADIDGQVAGLQIPLAREDSGVGHVAFDVEVAMECNVE